MKNLEWAAVALTLMGEFLLGFGKPGYVIPAYLFFMCGNVTWITFAHKHGLRSILFLNLVFFVLGVRVILNWA